MSLMALLKKSELGKHYDTLGKDLFNLSVDVSCHVKTFEDGPLMSARDQIEVIGMAIHNAKMIFRGNWHVTEQGYLVRGMVDGLENRKATLHVESLMTGKELDTLKRILDGMLECEYQWPRPHVHFEGGGIESIGGDERGLYLIGMHQDWMSDFFKDWD
jgi:hypothetical protein